MKNNCVIGLLIIVTSIFMYGCSSSNKVKQVFKYDVDGERHTAYNIWYTSPERAYAINYKKGSFIPAGTKVKNIKIRKGKSIIDRGQPIIIFTLVETEQYYIVHFQMGFHPNKTAKDYVDYMFTEKSFDEMTVGFNNDEILAIKQGEIITGMCKPVVIMSYGYPAEHMTISLDSSKWFYWKDRNRKIDICFDENIRTVDCFTEDEDEL